MGRISRREFIKGSSAAAFCALNQRLPKSIEKIYNSTEYAKDWNMRDYLTEFMESKNIAGKPEFKFPYDKDFFFYPQKLSISKDYYLEGGTPGINQSNGVSNRYDYYFAELSAKTKKKIDIKLEYGSTPAISGSWRAQEFLDIDGTINMRIPFLEHIESDKVYYRLSYRDGRNSYKPVSPICAFKNPVWCSEIYGYVLADTHQFDDYFNHVTTNDSGLEAVDLHKYFANFFNNLLWYKDNDAETINRIRCLKNTFNIAGAQAVKARRGTLPDFIINLGDDIGIWYARYKQQGFPENDTEANNKNISYELWKRQRLNWAIFTPVTRVFQALGNHDGEEKANRARKYAKDAREEIWRQPDYFKLLLANGRKAIYVLNSESYSGPDENTPPYRPEHYSLGGEQFKWFENELKEGKEEEMFIFYHRGLGGLPGGYGRGQLYTAKDFQPYINETSPPIDISRVEQLKVTDAVIKTGKRATFITGHDHIDSKPRKINDKVFGFCAGTTNVVNEEMRGWFYEESFRKNYGDKDKFDFITGPTINEIYTIGDALYRQIICVSLVDYDSNLRNINAEPGWNIRRNIFKNGQVLQDGII